MNRTWLLMVIPILACFMVADLAAGLDTSPKQVLIEARVIELGLKVGYLNFTEIEDIDNTIGFGLTVGKNILPNIKLEGNVDYWTKSQDEQHDNYKTEWSYDDLFLGATFYYLFPAMWRSCLSPEFGWIRPFVGLGGGAHIIGWDWKQGYNGDSFQESGSDTKFGFHGTGGIQMDLAPSWNGGLEFRYTDAHDMDNWGIFAKVNYLIEY
ncbi:outer membrane beta-barrel protein [Candidatus Zixiibacteriota bacterium]